ncbi:uncharacterized protein FSUBG_12844 [Fusarium subglutinans]|uniref:Fungal N-terminal domain-containing protein n=1 Tax=Gibberella subglutinans TaxID=42677 RepID=A0A8H5L5L8_GIBSU|nr:uncharacterized protein FSUBG_12844 [Fusarium subglutinans]KAF5584210.1 hypothetical protein FSUBG_12844 [Fusarium subglutinans]
MGDPLSIASGVAGLVSLGLIVCDGLHTYFSAIKDRKDDLAIVTQNLALFKFHIFAVQSSASKLGHHHSPAINGLQLSLVNCEMQLKCLESLLNELMPTEHPSLSKDIWRRQKLISRYPFHRKKLVQLEEYLSRANTTLSSFIQALNLLDVVGPKVEPSALQLLSSRVEDVAASSNNSIVLQQTAVEVAEWKTSFPGNERRFEDFAMAHSKSRYLQNAELERNFSVALQVPCNVVENSPAFQLFRIRPGTINDMSGPDKSGLGPGQFSESIINELKAIYRSGRASPFDVDQFGNNIAFICLQAWLAHFSYMEESKSSDITINAIRNMLTYLADIGVPIAASNFFQVLVTNLDSNFDHAGLYRDGGPQPAYIWRANGERVESVRSLMDMPSAPYHHLRPLDFALFHSRTLCSAPDQWTDCDECTCCLSVRLLLEADCNVAVGPSCPQVLAGCSLKARRLFFEHLKNRRQRLRNLAIAVLSEETLRRYGVTASSLPDKTAPLIWVELQETKDRWESLSVCLSDGLEPYRGFKPESFFAFPHALKVAELAADYGFMPKDESGVPTLLSGSHILDVSRPVTIRYLDWLLQYDLKLDLSLNAFRLSALHRIAVFIGDRIHESLNQAKALHLPLHNVSVSELQDARALLAAVCHSEAICNIPCPCSSGIFSRPLAHVLPAMLLYQDRRNSTYFFENMTENIEFVVRSIDLFKLSTVRFEQLYMAKCAIHILTMMSLRVRHLSICISDGECYLEDSDDDEEWREILDEDRDLIGQLEALDEEFGEAFDRQNGAISEFLSGYWLTRMEEVLRDLSKPLSDDDRYNLLGAGVVSDEDTTDGSECRVECTG